MSSRLDVTGTGFTHRDTQTHLNQSKMEKIYEIIVSRHWIAGHAGQWSERGERKRRAFKFASAYGLEKVSRCQLQKGDLSRSQLTPELKRRSQMFGKT